MLKDSAGDPAAVARDHARVGAHADLVYRSAVKGYAGAISPLGLETIRADPRVASVEPDRIVEALSQDMPTGIARIFADDNGNVRLDGRDETRVDVDIAIIDTGIDREHRDLNVVGRADCTLGSPLGMRHFPFTDKPTECLSDAGADGSGHGTHVAGTAGAMDDANGVVGVAPGARLWGVKVLNDSGSGLMSSVIAGVDWVTERADTIEVANMSLGCPASFCQSDALNTAIASSVSEGVVYAVAAGNSRMDANEYTPANHPDVITVSALADFDGEPGAQGAATCRFDEDDTLANFSNFGAVIEVAAPGVCILSTWPGGGYDTISGTSMASPHVAGAAALLASANNPADKAGADAIRQTIIDSGNYDWSDVLPPRCRRGTCTGGGSPDAVQEPLLDVHDAAMFAPALARGPFNALPIAKFAQRCNAEMTCSFDGSGSYDRDGSIARYRWNFGDHHSTATASTAAHTYRRAGTYVVTLTVTDAQGDTGREAAYVFVSDGKIGPHLARPKCGAPEDMKCESWIAAYDNANGYGFGGGFDYAFATATSSSGDRVFVTGTSWDNSTQSTDIATVAYDGATGKQLWVARYGPKSVSDSAFDLAVSPDGRRVYVTGHGDFNFFAKSDACPNGVPMCADAVTIAYDAATGAQLWTATHRPPASACEGGFGCFLLSEGNSVAVSPDGGRVYITGSTVGTCPPDTWEHSCEKYLTVAYDAASGNELWFSQYEDFAGYHFAESLAVNREGTRVYVTGTAEGEGFGCPDCGTDLVTVAYDAATGAKAWAARYHVGGIDAADEVRVSPDGSRVYVAGDTSPDFFGDSDYILAAYDASSGAEVWTTQYDGPGSTDRLSGFDIDGTGERVYATGHSGVASFPNVEIDAATVAFEAASGTQLWLATYRGSGAGSLEFGSGIVASPEGSRVYVAASTQAPLGTFGTPEFYVDYATLAYDARTGSESWVARYNSSPTGDHWDHVTFGYGGGPVALSADGSRLAVTGQFSDHENVANGFRYGTVAYDTRAGRGR